METFFLCTDCKVTQISSINNSSTRFYLLQNLKRFPVHWIRRVSLVIDPINSKIIHALSLMRRGIADTLKNMSLDCTMPGL